LTTIVEHSGKKAVEKMRVASKAAINSLTTIAEQINSAKTVVEPINLEKKVVEQSSTTIVEQIDEVVKVIKEFVEPWKGLLIGDRYCLKQELDRGGMGRVYLAEDTKVPGKPLVAVKIIMTIDSNLLARFVEEVELIASLTSPHIVKLSDYGSTPVDSCFRGSPFYVMEYLKGQTLRQRLQQVGALPIKQAAHILLQICAGLAEAHHHPKIIIHRDLKPENIFLIPGDEIFGEFVKIIDFGIAKKTLSQSHLTVVGSFVGTYRYAAPEQYQDNFPLDPRCDIYSLGLLLYEMLSGTNPYNLEPETATTENWRNSHLNREPQPLRSQPGCENLPAALEAIVMKCLQKSPPERFSNVEELEKALEETIR
jgi:serine/threonine-protein kinase